MRMEEAKWVMNWPCIGSDFTTDFMINESRFLHGDSTTTMRRVAMAPGNYAVRFALSPTITKSVFVNGVETKTIIHKGMVHLVRKANYIGAERGYLAAGPRH